MKIQKLNLAGIKNALTRAEMKRITAGSGSTCQNECGCTGCASCPSGQTCASVYCPGEPGFTHAVCI